MKLFDYNGILIWKMKIPLLKKLFFSSFSPPSPKNPKARVMSPSVAGRRRDCSSEHFLEELENQEAMSLSNWPRKKTWEDLFFMRKRWVAKPMAKYLADVF